MNPVTISKEEYHSFVDNAVELVLYEFREKGNINIVSKGSWNSFV